MSIRCIHLFLFFLLFIALAPADALLIPPVIVKAPLVALEPVTDKTIITEEALQETGVTTLAQALETLGGVQLHDLVGNSSQVLLGMRGFGANASSNTLFLINGIPITNPDLAPPDLNAIPLHEISYIEVIAGSESVLFGDQAVGGIINIVTDNKKDNALQLNCDAGSYAAHQCYFTWKNHYKELNYRLSLKEAHTDNYRDHNDYDQTLLSGGLHYPYSTGEIDFTYALTKEAMQYPGALTRAQEKQNRTQATNHTDFFRDWNGIMLLKQKQELSADWQWVNDISIRQLQGDGVLFSPFSQSRSTFFLRPTLNGTVKNIKVVGGFDLAKDRYHLQSAFGETNDDQIQLGLFALTTVPYEKFCFTLGARAAEQRGHLTELSTNEKNTNRAFALTTGASYVFLPGIHWYAQRAGNYRFPKADENASTLTRQGLKTQRGQSYETGIKNEQSNYGIKLALYQLNLTDEIAFDPLQTVNDPFGTNRNLPPTIRRGCSLSGRYKLLEKLTIDGQYNYVNARFQSGINVNKRIPLVAEHIARAGVNYHFLPHWHIYTEAIFTGNEYPANDDTNVGIQIGGYTVYNLHLRYQYAHFSASLRINNIFNKEYFFYTVFQTNPQTDFFYPAPTRNFTLTLNYDFI